MNYKSTREESVFMKSKLPITKGEDVEFSKEAADAEDLEAVERAEEADHRQEAEIDNK
jgi:hypothetical protein